MTELSARLKLNMIWSVAFSKIRATHSVSLETLCARKNLEICIQFQSQNLCKFLQYFSSLLSQSNCACYKKCTTKNRSAFVRLKKLNNSFCYWYVKAKVVGLLKSLVEEVVL